MRAASSAALAIFSPQPPSCRPLSVPVFYAFFLWIGINKLELVTARDPTRAACCCIIALQLLAGTLHKDFTVKATRAGGRTRRKARRPAGCEPPSAAPDRSFCTQLLLPRTQLLLPKTRRIPQTTAGNTSGSSLPGEPGGPVASSSMACSLCPPPPAPFPDQCPPPHVFLAASDMRYTSENGCGWHFQHSKTACSKRGHPAAGELLCRAIPTF